ncbi:uncharacterized protein LOC132624335 [Lycium barbarum]|uniref:uncharacterized protein LOC132624335 n=1 Tax=Lycium barbarum TaxID=112863 RepID=UPI00293F2D26|nr:uncharacterized protein LOC132624335 [Lycium barbarum]
MSGEWGSGGAWSGVAVWGRERKRKEERESRERGLLDKIKTIAEVFAATEALKNLLQQIKLLQLKENERNQLREKRKELVKLGLQKERNHETSVGHEEESDKNEQSEEQQADKEDEGDDEVDKDEETREESEKENEKSAEGDEANDEGNEEEGDEKEGDEGDERGEEDAETEKGNEEEEESTDHMSTTLAELRKQGKIMWMPIFLSRLVLRQIPIDLPLTRSSRVSALKSTA